MTRATEVIVRILVSGAELLSVKAIYEDRLGPGSTEKGLGGLRRDWED